MPIRSGTPVILRCAVLASFPGAVKRSRLSSDGQRTQAATRSSNSSAFHPPKFEDLHSRRHNAGRRPRLPTTEDNPWPPAGTNKMAVDNW